MKILVVEDDQFIAETLADALTEQLFVVDIATDGQVGWEQAQAYDYDLILLDVMLPKLDGITLCQKLRYINQNIPILLLTARNNNQDKVKGLNAGADDYVVKPFNLEELLARIRALLRRGNESASPIKKWGNLCLNPENCEVTYNNKQLNLTPKEYEILNLFMHNNQRVFSCSAILDKVWSFEDTPTEDTVRAHIK
ncbi:MAG: response regulator transcription factor, partial [Okeania sp. SIO1H6]|nr:response regulator transcription factor [Okeania sp. SIO1H6]